MMFSQLSVILGLILFSTAVGTSKGPINRAEISDRLLKQILRKPSFRLHGEGFSPGRNSARAENPSPVFSNRARIFSPAKRAEKSM